MELATLSSSYSCCTSTPQDRSVARVFLTLLYRADVPPDSLSQFYILARHAPFGKNGFAGLRRCHVGDFDHEWIRCELPRRRNNRISYQPIFFNLFRNSPSVSRFLSTPAEQVTTTVLAELALAYKGDEAALKSIFFLREYLDIELESLIESQLLDHFPPLLIAYANFRPFNFALPSEIRLDATTLPSPSRGRRNSRLSHRIFPNFFQVRKVIVDAIKGQDWTRAEAAFARLSALTRQNPRTDDFVLCAALQKATREPLHSRKPDHQQLQRLLSALPSALRMIQDPEFRRPANGVLPQAIKIMASVLALPGSAVPSERMISLLEKSPSAPRGYTLLPPRLLRAQFMTETPPKAPEDAFGALADQYERESASRIILNLLWEAGGRSVSTVRVELRHIVMSGPFVDIVIPESKGKHRNFPHPASRMWSAEELHHLRDFIGWLHRTGRYRPDTRLTELAGFGRLVGKSEVARRAISKIIEEHRPTSNTVDRLPTHIPRITMATLLPIRCLVAHHRWLLDEPVLAFCRHEPWFEEEALNRFKKIYPSAAYSVLEISRRLLMQSSPREFAVTYSRSMPILLALWANPRLRAEF